MNQAAQEFKSSQRLDRDLNPFAFREGASLAGNSVHTALEEVTRYIELEQPVIAVVGQAGTGKTLLMDMIARTCSKMGLAARQIERGDQVETALGSHSDVLVVDEADSMPETVASQLLSTHCNVARTVVLLCLPRSVHRFAGSVNTKIVELQGLPVADAETYLLERAKSIGVPDLFTPDALDLIISAARGSSRLLRSIAGLAFIVAVYEGAAKIEIGHVNHALEFHMAGNSVADEPSQQQEIAHDGTRQLGNENNPPLKPLACPPALRKMASPLRWADLARLAPVAGATTLTAGFMAVVIMVTALLIGSNDPGEAPKVSRSVTAAARPASIDAVQTPAPVPSSLPGQTSAENAGPVEEAKASAPKAAQKTVVAPNTIRTPGTQARTASRRTRFPVHLTDKKIPREQPRVREAAVRGAEVEQAVRHAEEAARQADEAVRQAGDAARLAEEAARQADEAARQADEVARRAEQMASQAPWGGTFRFPWQR